MATWRGVESAFTVVTTSDSAKSLSADTVSAMGLVLALETDPVAKQRHDDLAEAMRNSCSAVNALAASTGAGELYTGEETKVPAIYFPGTGTLILQDMPRGQRSSGDAVVAPMLIDAEWATYFFNRVTELLYSVEQQLSQKK